MGGAASRIWQSTRRAYSQIDYGKVQRDFSTFGGLGLEFRVRVLVVVMVWVRVTVGARVVVGRECDMAVHSCCVFNNPTYLFIKFCV